MTDVKLSLSIILPGSVMLSEQECSKQLKKQVKNKSGKVITKNGKPLYKKVNVLDFDKCDSFELSLQVDKKTEIIKVFTRKCKQAKQVINLSEAAFQYFISNEQPSEFRGNWKSLSKNKKISWHCNRIAQQMGGILENFQILD